MRTGRYSADAGEENHSSPRSSTIASHGMFRKLAAGVLAVATMFGGMALGSTTASAATSSRRIRGHQQPRQLHGHAG